MLREQGLDSISNYVFQSSQITFEILKNLLHLCSHFHTLFINIFPEPSNLKLDMFPILLYIKKENTLRNHAPSVNSSSNLLWFEFATNQQQQTAAKAK